MNKKILITLTAILVITLPITVIATSNVPRSSNLKSSGEVRYTDGTNEVFISSDDLIYLADEIDTVETMYKEGIVEAVNELDKYDAVGDVTATNGSGSYKTFGEIKNYILNSQSIPNTGEEIYVNANGSIATDSLEEGVTTTQMKGATAENLSAGTAAWVDGQYIVGTGGDNNSYYAQGVVDGMQQTFDNLDVQYTYHVHTGDSNNGGGCYTAPNIINIYCTGWVEDEFDINGGTHIGTCNKCKSTQYCNKGSHSCGEYKGTRQDGWKLGCGKTTDTIESATIIY